MEIIKQGIHVPASVVKQVAIIFAGTNGYLDDIPVNRVRDFEDYLGAQMDTRYGDFIQSFEKTLAMTDELKASLKRIIEETKGTFKI